MTQFEFQEVCDFIFTKIKYPKHMIIPLNEKHAIYVDSAHSTMWGTYPAVCIKEILTQICIEDTTTGCYQSVYGYILDNADKINDIYNELLKKKLELS
jgi:hypothetical protein